jgi:DNA-binding NarL/FixJ family response regulator
MRVVIGEDLALLRDGLVRLVTAYGMQVVEAVDSGPALLRALLTQVPDVAIVDVRLPPSYTDEGLRAAIEARRQRPGLPIMILSAHIEPLYARELVAGGAGGAGYLLKDRVADVLRFVEAVRVVAAGGTVLDPEVVAPLLSRPAPPGPLGRLTDREREVLTLMAQGRTNASMAADLGITEKAISKHINSIFLKLDLPADHDGNRRVLAVLAYLAGQPQ